MCRIVNAMPVVSGNDLKGKQGKQRGGQ